MQIDEYKNIYENEDTHWWYKSMHDIVVGLLEKNFKKNTSVILLDAGCGTGGMLEAIRKRFPSWSLIGLDIHRVALTYCRQRKFSDLLQGSVEGMPFKNESVDVIVSTDVLYHARVSDDEKSLSESYRILKKNGYLVLQLPAFNFLKSIHDDLVFTKRRYTKSRVCRIVSNAGFMIIKSSYRCSFLFFVLLAKKAIDRIFKRRAESNLNTVPKVINNLMNFVMFCEGRILSFLDLPIGSSLICLCKK